MRKTPAKGKLGTLLDQRLEQKGQTYQEAGRELGVSSQSVIGWRAGGIPHRNKYLILAKYLGITEQEIIAVITDPENSSELPVINFLPLLRLIASCQLDSISMDELKFLIEMSSKVDLSELLIKELLKQRCK